MSLEHRWSARRSVHFDAVIFHRPLGLVRSKVLAVSLEGVRAHTGRFSLPENASVELTFALALHAADKPQVYQMEAIVVHRRGSQHGLMFREFKLNAFQALHVMLSAA